MEDPTNLRQQELDAQAQAKQAQYKREQEVDDFRRLMAQEWGRRLMWRLLEMTGVFRSSMTGDASTFFNEGRRDIGLQLMAEVNDHTLDEYVQMLKEHKAHA